MAVKKDNIELAWEAESGLIGVWFNHTKSELYMTVGHDWHNFPFHFKVNLNGFWHTICEFMDHKNTPISSDSNETRPTGECPCPCHRVGGTKHREGYGCCLLSDTLIIKKEDIEGELDYKVDINEIHNPDCPYGNPKCPICPSKSSPKQSNEIEKSNIDFKSKTDWQAHFIQLEQKLNEAITHITKLERRERE